MKQEKPEVSPFRLCGPQSPGLDKDAAKTAAQGGLLYNRLVKRFRHLRKWAKRTGTDAFRLYDRDIPEIPLVLDYYAGTISGALYKRPYEKDEAGEENWLSAMRSSAARALGIGEDRIFLKQRRRLRRRQEGGVQYGKTGTVHAWETVHEGDLAFRVNLSDYLDTGLFLDARKRRARIRAEAAGKRVLNLFAYTCTLSVCAASGGASQVDSVDLSRTYLDWGAVNFALNGLEARSGESGGFGTDSPSPSPFTLIRADVIPYLSQAASERRRWDLIILDPPSFSNSKRMAGALDIRRDHRPLILRCLSLLNPGGQLWFSSSARGFSLDPADFPGVSLTAADMKTGGKPGTAPEDEDFRGKKIPRCYTLMKKEAYT